MITGQNGILNMARRSADETTRAELIEEARRAIIEQVAENEGDNISKEQLHDILDKLFNGIPDVYVDSTTKEKETDAWANDFPKNFPSEGADGKLANPKEPYEDVENVTVYDIFTGKFADGTGVTGGSGAGGGGDSDPGGGGGTPAGDAVDAEEVAKDVGAYIGDYVKYGVDLDGNEATPDWRIFYAENGNISLISADYVPMSHEAMTSVGNDTELEPMADSLVCAGTYDAQIFSPIPNEPDNFLTVVKHTKYDLTAHQDITNSKMVSQLLNTTAWSGFKTEKAEFAIGGPTLEMWCASWNAVLDKKGAEEPDFKKIEVDEENTTNEGEGYCLKSTDTNQNGQTDLFMDGLPLGDGTSEPTHELSSEQLLRLEADYSTFFPHTADEFTANGVLNQPGMFYECSGYWVASPSSFDTDAVYIVRTWFIRFAWSL